MTLTLSLVNSALTEPLLLGRVPLPGVQVIPAKSVDDNSRRMLAGEFDIAEMSLATFVRAACQGGDLIGLPLFLGRRFVHEGILVHRDAGIAGPRDLAGRRVAVPQYWLTSSVWHRGLLRDEHGVDGRDIDWVTIAPERGDAPTPPARVTRIDGASIAELLADRRVDAALVPRPPSPEHVRAGAVALLPDAQTQQQDYFQRTGIVPILHFVAIRRSLIAAQPGLAAALREAFERCAEADAEAHDLPSPIGLASNRPALERFLAYVREQGLVGKPLALEELFVPEPWNQEAS